MKYLFFLGFVLLITFEVCAQGSGYNLLFSEASKANVAIEDDPSFDHPGNTFTIEAWIYPTAYPSSAGLIFCKHETVYTREYDIMLTPSGTIRISVYDQASTAYMNYSTAVLPLNQWSHVVHVYSYAAGKQYFYLNGILESTFNIGSITLASTSTKPMIGAYWIGNDTRSHFTGYIEEVRLWHSERTQTQIRDNMCQKLSGSETGLVAYYPLNEGNGLTTDDASSNNNTGTLVNNPGWNLSSAPIGDQSTYAYTSSWSGQSLHLSSAQTGFTVSNVSSLPKGFHIYRVDAAPNSLTGISNPSAQVYYGTFAIGNAATPGYDVVYNYTPPSGTCVDSPVLYYRDHNADPTWADLGAISDPVGYTMTKNNIMARGEFIVEFSSHVSQVDLGPDIQVCDASSITLSAGQGFTTYTWQDNSTGSQYVASSSGTYSVTVTGACGSLHDEVEVSFLHSPHISLGNDTSFCLPGTLSLTPGSGYDSYLWQDHSTLDHLNVTGSGTYSVTVSNACGTDSDAIQIAGINAPDISLGNDANLCLPGSLVLSPGSGYNSYQWQDYSTLDHLEITSGGVYSVTVSNTCGTDNDQIQITAIYAPDISLGNDRNLCLPGSLLLTPGSDYDSYLWQDHSTLDHLNVASGGTYSVTVSNACGTDSDEIQITGIHSPNIQWSNELLLCAGSNVELYPGNYTSYLWQDGSVNSHYSVTQSGSYSVTVSNACGSDQAQIAVNIVKANIPNLITPNGDGKNEALVIQGVGTSIGSLDVYNQWGTQVFSADHYTNNWNGENLSDGVYYYKYGYQSDACEHEKGWVQIIR